MEYKELTKVISTKKYKQNEFNLNRTKMSQLINAINDIEINDDAWKIIRIMIRFFRFPILILFRKFYDRLERQNKVLAFIEDQKKTGSLVVNILEEKEHPSLKFYTKAGFKVGTEEFKRDEVAKDFQQFILKQDNKLQKILGDKSKYQIDQLKFITRQLNELKQRNKLAPIYDFCVDAYIQIANEKRKQIESFIIENRPQRKMDDLRNKLQPQKIFIEQGSIVRQIRDNRISQDYLCCRPYFYMNEIINEPQTITQEYKHYSYPYNKFLNQILMKTIVGFLNGRGGIIYIGIRENNDTKKRLIKGQIYTQSLKEDVLKHFRQLGQRISPQIVNNQLYKLEYVPIRDENAFIAGLYIIRLKISKGQKDELYCFKNYNGEEVIAFRTANQVLQRRLGQQMLELYRQKISQPDEPEESNHAGSCKKPEIGRPLYQSSKSNNYNNYNSEPQWIKKSSK